MSTVARMLVEMAGDPTGLRRAFRDSIQDAQRFGRDLRNAVNTTTSIVDGAGYQAAGRRISENLLRGMKSKFDADMATAREQMARGIINPQQFRQAGELAASGFNAGLLSGIGNLRGRNLLSAEIHQQLVRELKDAGMEAGREARMQMVAQLNALGGDLQKVGQVLRSAGTRMTVGVTLPLVAFGVAASKSAADANESFNKFDVLFGRMAGNVGAQLAQMHKNIPATTAQLKDMASSFQALLVPMGIAPDAAARMSLRLTELGGDLTSLHNIPVQETMQRLFSGLVGETEAVRRFGVDISEARLKILAHNAGLGDNVQALTRAQKTQLIFNEILRSTSVAHGDAAMTAGSASNQMRFLARDTSEAAQVFGQRLLPTLVPLMQSLSRVLESVGKLSPSTLDLAIKVGLTAAALGPLLTVLGSVASVMGMATKAAAALAGASAAGAGAGGLAAIVAALMGPAGLIILLGAATAALFAWVAQSRAAATDVDKLAASFRGLSQAQLMSRIQTEAGNMAKLQQQANAARSSSTSSGGTIMAGSNATGANLTDINQKIDEQQALLNGLAKAYNEVGAANQKAAADAALNIRRNDEMVRALSMGVTNALAEANAAAAAAKKNHKDHTAYMQALAGEVSSLSDMYTIAQRFGLSQTAIVQQGVHLHQELQDELVKAGGHLDANTAKLYNMLDALEKIRGVAEILDMSRLQLPSPTMGADARSPTAFDARGNATEFAARQSLLRGGAGSTVGLAGVGGRPGFTLPAPMAAAPPAALQSDAAVRFNAAMASAAEAARSFGSKVRDMVAPLGTAMGTLLNPLRFFGGVVQRLANALQPVLDPLLPVFESIAQIMAETLAPVMQALAPVIAALTPLIRAVMQVLGPILTALVPLFRAMIPLLNALFPIFKLLGIAATYIGQAFGIAASIVLRAVGNIIIGFGRIIKAIAQAIDKIPGIDARGAIRFAQGIIDFGDSMLASADEFKAMANDMAHAREEIRKVNLDPAAEGAQHLADATNAAAEAMTNVPTIFRYRQRLTEQWGFGPPLGGRGGSGTVDTNPLGPQRNNLPAVGPSSTSQPGPASDTSGMSAAGGDTFHVETIIIQSSGDGEETLDAMREAARRRAMATSGQSTRASIAI